MPLFKTCKEQVTRSISKDNVYEVIKAAYFTDDDDLMNCASEFVTKNRGQFHKDNDQWKEFQKLHPQCFVKMMDVIMFDDGFELKSHAGVVNVNNETTVIRSEFFTAERIKEVEEQLKTAGEFSDRTNRIILRHRLDALKNQKYGNR